MAKADVRIGFNRKALATKAMQASITARLRAQSDLVAPLSVVDVASKLGVRVTFNDINMEGMYQRGYARDHNFLNGVTEIDFGLLRTIRSMTSHLEVRAASAADWELAILAGFKVWRDVLANRGGEIVIDLDSRSIHYVCLI